MLQIIFAAIPIVLSILGSRGIIPAQSTTLASNLLGPVETLIASLRTGQAKTQDALAALGALAGVIAVLKADTTLEPETLTEIANLDSDIQAALKAYAMAANGYDASVYGQIAPV